jgi:LuxR family transcriptional regulator, maltose regulon positive regulatory protein
MVAVTGSACGSAALARAYSLFEGTNDPVGLLLTCAEMLHTFLCMPEANFALAQPWIARYAHLLGADPAATLAAMPDAAAARVIAAAQALRLRDPRHALLPRLAALGEKYGAKPITPDARLSALIFPIVYRTSCGDFKGALRCADRAIAVNTASPAPLLAVLLSRSVVLTQQGEHEAAFAIQERAQALATKTGVAGMQSHVQVQRIFTALSAGDVEQGDRLLTELGTDAAHGRAEVSALVCTCRAGFLLLTGEIRAARELLHDCIPLVDRAGDPFGVASARVQLGQALMLQGDHDEARNELARVLEFARPIASDVLAFRALIALSYSYLKDRKHDERTRGLECLREALAIGKRRDYRNCHPVWLPHVMSFVFSRALEAEIEPDYVRRFIELRAVDPEGPNVPHWPWPLRVYTFQTFDVLKHDRPLRAGSKTPRRVFELLQAIAALGPRTVSRERLLDVLWPQCERGTAQHALESTLQRLQRLLGDDAVLIEDGHVSLAENRVWIDVEAFERLTEDARLSTVATAASAVARHVDKALTLYAGHFLDEEREQRWMLPTRERLRSRLERLVTWAGTYWEEHGDIAQARELYQRAMELDPRAATFYRRLTACHEGAW